jgi:hypothetical protein
MFVATDERSKAAMPKIPRNAPCPCGSGLKYKKCHGQAVNPPSSMTYPPELLAAERIRKMQQGLGRPIVATKLNDHQIVAVGNTIHWSNKWKTFPDFLADYMKMKLGPDWGNAELAKPFADRHPLLQWYHDYCLYQQSTIKMPGEIASANITGLVACYLGTAYALYLLDHNVELQNRFINRLKDVGQFQGAYYELIVASILIRAGFTLTLEDETDAASKHCEFKAISGRTGKSYWVEAKMRAVEGALGRTTADGGPDGRPLARLIPHLNKALAKPAADERLIFIDVNTPPAFDASNNPDWLEPVMRRLEQYERTELPPNTTAYVWVTNIAFHRQLDQQPSMAATAFGLGMPDFNRSDMIRLGEAYRRKQKHIDAHDIGRSLEHYLRFPTTFDGNLPSEAFGYATSRVKIGERYIFSDPNGTGEINGLVTAATVDQANKEAVIGVTLDNQTSYFVRVPMSESDMAEWKEFGNAFFGNPADDNVHVNTEFDLFEWLMKVNNPMSREKMLAWFSTGRDVSELEKLSDEDLLMEYCEGHVAALRLKGNPDSDAGPENVYQGP